MDIRPAAEQIGTASNSVVQLSTFGAPILFLRNEAVKFTNRKALALLVYVANTTNGTETRQRLAGLLWSESSEEKARASLRQSVADLRAALGEAGGAVFLTDRHTVRISAGMLQSDATLLKQELKAGRIDPRLLESKRLCETFLAGFDDLDPAFQTWLTVQRQCLHDEYVRLLEDLVRARPNLLTLKHAGVALLNLDPTHEIGCRAAIEASSRLGDVVGALRIYRDLWTLLEEDYGEEPSSETQSLIADVKMGRLSAMPAGQDSSQSPTMETAGNPGLVLPRSEVLQIVVGDFANSLSDPSLVPPVRVFRHELIAALVRFRDWAVTEHDPQRPLPLHRPGYLIEATSFGSDGTLRMVLTLKEMATTRFIWSEQFAIAPSGWYQTQQRIIRRVAVALDVSLSSERLAQISGIPELSLDQFDRWLKGQELVFRWRPDDEARAESLFRSIVDQAPGFAPAYAGIAGILNSRHLIFPGKRRSAEQHAEALGFARTAVRISPIDSRAHLHLAWSFAMNGMHDRAATSFLMACELNPNDPWTLVSSTLGLAYCNDLENASRLSRLIDDSGLGMSSLNWSYQAGVRFVLEDFKGCASAAEEAGDAVYYIGAWHAAALALQGDGQAARRAAQHFLDLIQSNWFGDEEADAVTITRWLLDAFPLASAKARMNLARGLALAGLPADNSPPAVRIGNARSAAAADRIVRNS